MDEQQWLACTDPQPMLESLRGKVSDRKLRLFAVSCFRRVWGLVGAEARAALEACEGYAEGRVTPAALRHAFEAVPYPADLYPASDFAGAGGADFAALLAANAADFGASDTRPGSRDEREASASLGRYARDILGNPFRTVALDPAWLTPDVQALARAAYEGRDLPQGTLDPARLAVLADALEEAGCRDQQILRHLRGPGPHVRGCWVIDLLLGSNRSRVEVTRVQRGAKARAMVGAGIGGNMARREAISL
jgi:hypothetical protein